MPSAVYLRLLYLSAFVSQSLEAFSFSVAEGSFDSLPRIWAVALGLKKEGGPFLLRGAGGKSFR